MTSRTSASGRTVRRAALTALVALVALLVAAPGAGAHPLGNFTTNTATGLRVAPDAIHVDRILDLAEIPTLQAIQADDTADAGTLTGADAERFTTATCAQLREALTLTVDGRVVPLRSDGAAELTFPPGEAGLATLRLECPLVASVRVGSGVGSVELTDAVYPDRLGWREITAVGDGVELTASDVPPVSVSGRLTAYPEERLASPLDERDVQLQVRAGGAAFESLPTPAGVPDPVARGLDRLSGAFTALVAIEDLTVPFALLALVAAAALGTLHAFAPGHGKTVIAAYLVGRHGTARDAFLLGGTVAVTHTLGVLLLGVGLSLTATASPEALYPWLGITSGLLFVAVGIALLRQARRGGGHVHGPGGHVHGPDGRILLVPLEAPAPSPVGATGHGRGHDHGQGDDHGRGHDHGQGDDHGRGHDHGQGDDHGQGHDHGHDREAGRALVVSPEREAASAGVVTVDAHHHDGSRLTTSAPAARQGAWRGLLAPGLAGGLVPSPSALLVLLGGFAIGRAWFGVGLVIAYGIGMALTLVGAGYLLLRVRARLDASTADGRRSARLLRLGRTLPVLTSASIVIGGLVVVGRSLLAL